MSAQERTSALGSLDDYRIISNIDPASLPPHLRKSCILFFAPETEELAIKIAAQNSNIQLAKCRWRKFPDGFPDL